LKVLAKEYPSAFIRLALDQVGLKEEDWQCQAVENPEVNIPEKRLDYVYRLELEGEALLLHLEFQLRHQPDMPERMFKYSAFLTEALRLPVVPVVVYLERVDYDELPRAYTVKLKGQPVASYTYQVIRLWDRYEAISQGDLRELAPLLPMLADHRDEKVLERTKELILEEKDPKRRADSLSIALTIAERYFDRETLLRLFREEILMSIKESSFVQEWYNEGLQKGIEKGRQEGIERGRLEALRADILDVLSERFGQVDADIIQAVNQIEATSTLKSILKMSVKVASLRELKKALNLA